MKKSKTSKSASENGSLKKNGAEDFLVAGIGASAGGIQALKEFFENVSADSGVAYVVILHLSPDHESRLAEILQTTARIPVTQVKERVKVEPNHVYVVPPNQYLEMLDGHIGVEQNASGAARRAPVDIFFRTLAEARHAGAIAVVLSGTGADGSMGLKRVKEKGGVVFVQNPREAEFSEMPRNSIATDLVDQVLNVGEIPAKIVAYKDNLGAVSIEDYPESRPEDDQAALREIFAVLRVRTGHDFSNYKHPTVLRRVERRINVRELQTLGDYAVYMRDNVDEPVALLKDLLISVTNFFRDKEAFQFLETEIVPRILQDKTSPNEIRVWVAGCATGEEAYSLAMLFCEQTEDLPIAPKIQIFATDIDEDAIAHSREGFYTPVDAADVSPERLRRFFTKEGGGFRARRELREMILFARHNVLKDAPFSHLDLVTCRNLLIYFNGTAQQRAMETFHFALNPGSFLFLGTPESIDGAGDLYAPVNREFRIYQSRQAAAKIAYPAPDAPVAIRYAEPKTLPPSVTAGMAGTSPGQENRSLGRISFGDLHQQLLEQYAPPSVVVNENYDIVHLSPRAGRFLQIAGGEPSKNLLHLVRPELRLELSTALFQAVRRRANVVAANLKVQNNGRAETIDIQVRPVLQAEDTARGFLLVIFELPQNGDAGEAIEKIITSDEPLNRRLEAELERTKTQLRTSVEQYETQTEELRASNEELQAMNEELRSTAEELETSREELQSVNEELMTVNQELRIKIDELSVSNNDIKNLLDSTDIGTIFLDRSLRVKMFTPPAREVFNLIDADINRPLADIATKIDFANLHRDVKQVLETLQAVEREFETDKGKWYLMRVFPYRTVEDKISGAVVTFIEITNRVSNEHALRNMMQARERQTHIFDTTLSTVDDFIYIFDKDGRFIYSNPALLDLLGITLEEIVGKNFYDLDYPEDLAARLQSQIQRVFDTKETVRDETPFTSPTGAGGFYEYIFNPVTASDGSVESVAGSTRDITTRKRSEVNFAFLAEVSQDLARLSSVEEMMRTTGAKIGAFLNLSNCSFMEVNEAADTAVITQDWHRADVPSLAKSYRIGEFVTGDFQRACRAGEVFVVRDTQQDARTDARNYAAINAGAFVSVPLVRDGEWRFLLVAFDSKRRDWRAGEIELISELTTRVWTRLERARAEENLRVSEERLRGLIKNLPGGAAFIVDRDLRYLLAEGEALAEVGYAPADLIGKTIFEAIPPESASRYEPMYRKALAGESFTHEHNEYGGTYLTRGTPLRSANGEIYAALAVSYDISDRKRAEEKLRDSEERFRAMFEQANVGIVQTTIDGQLIAPNPGFCKIIGYEETKAKCLNLRDITHPDDYEREVESTRRLIGGEIAGYSIEKRYIRQDGTIIWGEMTATLMRDADGNAAFALAVVEDISERKAAEEAVRESETQMRLVVEAAEMGTWDWDLRTGAVRWNDQHFRLFGREPENRVLSYKDFEQGVHPDYREVVRERLEQAIEENKVFQTEFLSLHPDRSTRWMSGYGRVIERDAEGKAMRMTGVMFDATERKAAEDAVRESEERLRLLVESASDYAIFTMSLDNKINTWNTGAEKVFGWTESEAVGQTGAIIFTSEDRAKGEPEKEIKTALRNGRAPDERFHLRKDDSRFFVSGVMTLLKDADGEVQGFAKIARDMTERLEAEKAVRDKEMLQKLVGAQEDERKRIARDLHDHLGQQLTALRLKLEAVRKECESDELCAKIDETQVLARHLDNDVDFLAWELRPAALDDLGLIAALKNYVREWSHYAGVTADFHTSGLNKLRLTSEIETNLYRITQEALNNTHKHAKAKKASVMLERRDNLIVLIVEDDGAGFNPKNKKTRGKGLGLIGMRERAALLKGTSEIESAPNGGTTIFVRVPAEFAKKEK